MMQKNRIQSALLLILLVSFHTVYAASITGEIKDEQGRPLRGVNVFIKEINIGTTSNQLGFFSLENLPDGAYTLVCDYMGYKSRQIVLDVDERENEKLNIVLTEDILKMDAVLVSAQKKVEQIQDVPVSMSVIEGSFLEQSGPTGLDVLSGFVPGINIHAHSENRPNFVIRGLTSDAFLASSQPRVSVFYNNIPVSRNTGAWTELFDMERIEILKGPQGTLFGRGAQIGSVSLISRKPEPVFNGGFATRLGTYGQQIYNGTMNIPVTETFFSRFAFAHSSNDGFVDNTYGGNLNDKNSNAFRTSLRYLPGSGTIIDMVYDYQEDHPGGTAFMSRTYPNQRGKIDIFDDEASFERGRELGLDRRIHSFSLNVHHYFNPGLDLNTFISFREHEADEVWDGDGSAAPALHFEEMTEVRQITFETRLSFSRGHRFNGFAGISYWNENVDQTVRFSPNEQSLFFLFTDPSAMVDEQGNPRFIQAIPPIPEFGSLGGAPLPTDHTEESFQNAGNQSVETFIDGSFRISNKLKLTAGLRIVADRLSLEAQNRMVSGQPSTLGYLTGNAPNVLIAPGEAAVKNKGFVAPVGRVLAQYTMNRNLNAYVSYARGRRPNVIQLRADAQTEILDDETVNSYETGVKATWADQLLWDASVYFYDYTDFQTRSWVADQETGEYQLIVKDGGKAHAYGFETSLRHRLSAHLEMNANYAYIHARFDEKDSDGNDQGYEGNIFRLTPEHTWSVTARFNRHFADNFRFFLTPYYSYKSHHYFEDDNSAGLEQDGYGLFHMQCGVYFIPLQVKFSLYGYNLSDEQYLVSAGNTGNLFGIPTFVPGRPQTFGLGLHWDF